VFSRHVYSRKLSGNVYVLTLLVGCASLQFLFVQLQTEVKLIIMITELTRCRNDARRNILGYFVIDFREQSVYLVLSYGNRLYYDIVLITEFRHKIMLVSS